VIPVLYAVAMAVASGAAVLFGRVYDRVGLRGLIVLPPLAVLVPFLAFATAPAAFVLGAAVWGAGMGIHDSTLRAAVADLVPAHRRGAGYGTFTAIYGLAWLAGAALIGLLYEHGIAAVAGYVAATQALATVLLLPLLHQRQPPPSAV
jgi:MFS family permease